LGEIADSLRETAAEMDTLAERVDAAGGIKPDEATECLSSYAKFFEEIAKAMREVIARPPAA
jgi:hypothetical protein